MQLPDLRRRLDLARVTTLLCDADGTLFPSEEPAFDASATVVNRALTELGAAVRFDGAELRAVATGRNFRRMVTDLAVEHGVELPEKLLERWVDEELAVVTRHLASTLRPDARVSGPMEVLSARFQLAVVSSSALSRLAACLAGTGLDHLFPQERCFSAQDSLPTPSSKPDPAVYDLAGRSLGVGPGEALAIEDAASGVASARAAGFGVVGMVMFVPAPERAARVEELMAAGAAGVLETWQDLVGCLGAVRGRGDAVVAP